MTKLATFISGYSLSTVEIIKGYTMVDWREDIKKVLMQAGIKDKPTTFLFSDIQIINELMIEDINNLLNSGMLMYVDIYLYIYIYICTYMHIQIYIHT
jgi:dynein heavy chain